MTDRHDEDTVTGRLAMGLAMRWYGWGSPVGLGLFVLLIAAAVAVVRVAFR